MQEIVDATVAAIPTLPFKQDAFASVNPEVVELVLRDVPLNATEIEVWRAVKAWADEFFDLLSDPDFSPSCSPREEDAEPVVPEALKGILKSIDLACINWQEVCQVWRHQAELHLALRPRCSKKTAQQNVPRCRQCWASSC